MLLGYAGETCPPGNGLEHQVGREPDTTHASSTGIGGANGNGEIRDYLSNVGGSSAEVDSQVMQISKGISHWLPYADAVFVSVGEPCLKGAEETTTTGDGKDHAT